MITFDNTHLKRSIIRKRNRIGSQTIHTILFFFIRFFCLFHSSSNLKYRKAEVIIDCISVVFMFSSFCRITDVTKLGERACLSLLFVCRIINFLLVPTYIPGYDLLAPCDSLKE